jgi:hypothetical protein
MQNGITGKAWSVHSDKRAPMSLLVHAHRTSGDGYNNGEIADGC